MRRNKRDRFEGKEIIEVEKLDFQKIEHGLVDTTACITMDFYPHTEQAAQLKTKEIWSTKLFSEDEEDEDDEEPVRDDKLGEILFARLAAFSCVASLAGG